MDGGERPGADADADEESRYATALEDVFIEERGTPFLLSPKDWQLIRGWRARGIPADTVIRAVRETFEKRRARGAIPSAGKISSIAYCANAVEERWEMERRGLIGSVDAKGAPPPDVAQLLARLAEELAREREVPGMDAAAARRALLRASEKLLALDPTHGFDQLEEALSKIEASLAKKLAGALVEPAAAELARRVGELLGDAASMSPAVAERTRRALERREVRRLFELPPLTLFTV